MTSLEVASRTACDDAFHALALPHVDAIARVARALAGRGPDAEDLVQETYLRAFRHWSTFDRDTDCKRWLATICRNAFRELYRREQRSVSLHDHELDALAAARVHNEASAAGLEDMFARLDLAPAIDRSIDELAEHYRQVVVLVDVEGFDYQEVADVLDLPIGTVRSRLYRGRRLLQESLLAYAIDAGYRSANPPPS
jgi:RNA polymerase sigma-70 factor (ECF subfamily)